MRSAFHLKSPVANDSVRKRLVYAGQSEEAADRPTMNNATIDLDTFKMIVIDAI